MLSALKKIIKKKISRCTSTENTAWLVAPWVGMARASSAVYLRIMALSLESRTNFWILTAACRSLSWRCYQRHTQQKNEQSKRGAGDDRASAVSPGLS